MQKKFTLSALSAAILTVASSGAHAIEASSMKFGGVKLIPTLELSESYDDNFRAVGDSNDESSWITTINPNFELSAIDRGNIYKLTYEFSSDIFHSSHDDDNTDHHLTADAHMVFSSRSRLNLVAGYDRVEDVADTEIDGINDKYHTYNLGGVYGFGAESATMQFELGANQQWLRYDNDGNLNKDLERDTTAFTGTAYYRVAPKTRALAELRFSDFDYVDSNSTLDSDSVAYLLGLTWDATAKTQGMAKIGYSSKEFDDSSKDDADNSIWEVGVTWMPRSYSALTLQTRRSTEEGSEGSENYIDTTRTSLEWNHAWTHALTSDVRYELLEEDYENAANRKDDTDEFGIGLTYNLRRWVDVGVAYTYQDVESNVTGESYDRNIYMVKMTVGL